MGRPATQILSTAMIVAEAIDLIDSGEDFTMRKLASKLCVSAPSLYHYVTGKAHLINLIRDALLLDDPPIIRPEHGWRQRVEEIVRTQRGVYGQHPNLLPLFVATPITPGAVLEVYGALAGALTDAGFDPAQVGMYLEVLDSFALGIGLEHAVPNEVWAIDGSAPALRDAFIAWAHPAARLDAAFEFGLRVLLDAIERGAAGHA